MGVESTELARWFDAHGAALVLYARQWVPAALAEDVVQEVFVRLAALSVRPDNVRAWLLVCVRNGAMDAMRRHRRQEARIHRAVAERMFEPKAKALPFEGDLEAEEVQQALAELAMDQREVITLRIWNGATFEEISGITGMPLSTVYHRYRTGLEEMRSRWELPCYRKM
jgi:RNA polymerase sigma-70 factor (ECF subfamily)